MLCPLCKNSDSLRVPAPLGREFYRCANCALVYQNPLHRLSATDEKARYEEHNNDVDDPRYQAFMRPLCEAIRNAVPPQSSGLDFGAGTGPVLSKMLSELNFQVELYDPYFWPDPAPLTRQYDFVCASEVVEHLADPGLEFLRLRKLLHPGGTLGIMTLLHTEQTDLATWYYLRDPTHVCAYSRETFAWIKNNIGFARVEFPTDRVIVLTAE